MGVGERMTDDPARTQVTQLLDRIREGDAAAEGPLFGVLYEELHAIADHLMRGERVSHTLQTTALVHEAYLRLVGDREARWEGRAHFLRVAAKVMRAVLVDHARRRKAAKRGEGRAPSKALDDLVIRYESDVLDLLDLDAALERLTEQDEQLARLVELRFFGGLTIAETADAMGVSTPTIERGWRTARARIMVDLGM